MLAVPPSSTWSDRRGVPASVFTQTRAKGSPSAGVGALSMSGGGTDGKPATAAAGGDAARTGEAEGDNNKDTVPWVSWVSLAMLLLVYVSNQWTRSLVYCEYRVRGRTSLAERAALKLSREAVSWMNLNLCTPCPKWPYGNAESSRPDQ